MPIINLNGTTRKHGIANGRTIAGQIHQPSIAAAQHGTTVVYGKSYSSPFTTSSASLFNASNNNSTQPHLSALKVESPGKVVPVSVVVKIHPNEKGTFFSTTKGPKPVYGRTGGPSPHHDTASSPNTSTLKATPRPVRRPQLTSPEKKTHLSFLRSGGTLGGHQNTSSNTSRWHTIKKGVV